MVSYSIVPEGRERFPRRWNASWTPDGFRLTDPEGHIQLDTPLADLVPALHLGRLVWQHRLELRTANKTLRFRPDENLADSLLLSLKEHLQAERGRLGRLRAYEIFSLAFVLVLMGISGVGLGLYYWWASAGKPAPPEGSFAASLLGFQQILVWLMLFAMLVGLGGLRRVSRNFERLRELEE